MKARATVSICLIILAAGSLAVGTAQAAGPNWHVREAVGVKEKALPTGTKLGLEQFLAGGMNIYFWDISGTRTLVKQFHCMKQAYNGVSVTGGSPGTAAFEGISYSSCENLTFTKCQPSTISSTKLNSELVYRSSGLAGALLATPKEGSTLFSWTETSKPGGTCAESGSYKIVGTWLISVPFKSFSSQLLLQTCNTSMCQYNENGTGTSREARLYLGSVGSKTEVTIEAEDREVLGTNPENYKELEAE
jgi:hypothetical protein